MCAHLSQKSTDIGVLFQPIVEIWLDCIMNTLEPHSIVSSYKMCDLMTYR